MGVAEGVAAVVGMSFAVGLDVASLGAIVDIGVTFGNGGA